ncbi:MAG TPA: Maf family protein [Candidatus Tyrphobacter sp.]
MSAPTNRVLREIVLASGSPRRLELLRSLCLDIEVMPSGYDERDEPGAAPEDLARRHARAKLDAVRAHVPDRAVLAADTVVDLDGRSLGKPHDAADAARMLRSLSARTHRVHTAYALALPGSASPLERLSTTAVRFHPLDEAEIAAYVSTGEPMDKAGAYGIQGRAAALIASIDGDYFTVMGFPLGDFIRLLRRSGFALPESK